MSFKNEGYRETAAVAHKHNKAQGWTHPQRPPQLKIGKLRGQSQAVKGNRFARSIVPDVKRRHLKGRQFKIVLSDFSFECQLENKD